MRRIMLACVALLALSAVAPTANAAPRNYSAYRGNADGFWRKGYGWAGYGWYSARGDYVGNGYSSIGVMYPGSSGDNPSYLSPGYSGFSY